MGQTKKDMILVWSVGERERDRERLFRENHHDDDDDMGV